MPVVEWNVEQALCYIQCTCSSKLKKSDHPSQIFLVPFKYFVWKEDGDAALGVI